MNRVFDIASAIVAGTAIVAVLTHPETAANVKALGDLFTGSLRTMRGS